MNNKFASGFLLVLGAIIGSAVTWKYIKKKYEEIAQDEIDSVKEAFSKREANIEDELENTSVQKAQEKSKPTIAEYAAKLQEQSYTNYSNMSLDNEKAGNEENIDGQKPYVITPEDFGECDDYEKVSLIYYADQVLADDDDQLVDDVKEVVGIGSLNRFGEYEDDSVFVRNDRLKCDYEILLDQRRHADVVKRKPMR